MLSIIIRGFILILCGCQIQKQTENITEILETVESFRERHQIKEAIDYLIHKEIYKNADLLETLAFLYEENNEKLLAAQTFEQLFHADIDQQCIEYAFHAAEIYRQLGDFYSAGRCYRLYLDLNPEDYCIWFKLSDIEEQLQQPSMALTAYFNGLKAAPVKTEKHIKKLSELCYQNGMLDAAQFWGQKILNIHPNDVSILEMLLKIADAHNDRNKAIFCIQKLKDLNIDVPGHYPDFYKKYAYVENIAPEIPITERNLPHSIQSTPQEIERTLQWLSPGLKPNNPNNYFPKTIPNPLCPSYIY